MSNDFPARLDAWTVGDLQRKLKSIGAMLSHAGQNLNERHFPRQVGHWSVVLINPPDYTGPDRRFITAQGAMLEIAIARAIKKWEDWTPPDYGASLRREPEPKSSGKKMGGAELFALLGLKKDDNND